MLDNRLSKLYLSKIKTLTVGVNSGRAQMRITVEKQ